MKSSSAIGSRIRTQRFANGLTQAQLAAKLHVKQPTIAVWESGKQTPPESRIEELERVIGHLSSGQESEPYETPSILGKWLSQNLSKKNMTVAELADKSGVSSATIYNLQNGRAENARQSTIEKLEFALGERFPKEFRNEIEADSKVQGFGEFLDFNPNEASEWPSDPGIYVLYDIANRPTYVGQGNELGTIRIKNGSSPRSSRAPHTSRSQISSRG